MSASAQTPSVKRFSVLSLVSFVIFVLQWILIYVTPPDILLQRLLINAPSQATILTWVRIVFALIFVRTYTSLIFTETDEFVSKVIIHSKSFQKLGEWLIRLFVTISLYLSTLTLTLASSTYPFGKLFLFFSGTTFLAFLFWDLLLNNTIRAYDSFQFWSWIVSDCSCVVGFFMYYYLRSLDATDLQSFCIGIFIVAWLIPFIGLIVDLYRKFSLYRDTFFRTCKRIVNIT